MCAGYFQVLLDVRIVNVALPQIIQAGHGGSGAPVVAAAATAVALLAGFLTVERSCPDPMLPLGLFRRAAFSTANSVAAAMNLDTRAVPGRGPCHRRPHPEAREHRVRGSPGAVDRARRSVDYRDV